MFPAVVKLFLLVSTTAVPVKHQHQEISLDVLVYGATPAGIAAGIAAATTVSSTSQSSSPVNVALVVSEKEIGGMMSGGLGWDDVYGWHSASTSKGDEAMTPRPYSIYGNASLYALFADKVQKHYASISPKALNLSVQGTHHEPHVAGEIFSEMLSGANIRLVYSTGLPKVKMSNDGIAIQSVILHNRSTPSQTFNLSAAVFIDASYEGDLLHAAGAPYRVGRESRREFGELNAGIVFTDNVKRSFLRGTTGTVSDKVPAMTWRLCFTTNVSNRVEISTPPPLYNRSLYLGYIEDVKAGRLASVWHAWSGPRPLPPDGTKFDINCNPRPLGFIWAGDRKDRYIVGNDTERQVLVSELRDMALGLLYFQQHDEAVPLQERIYNQRFGLCADEFQDNGHFPTQLYIREARRLTSLRQFSEHDMVPVSPIGRPPIRPDSIAVGSFPIDSFPCTNQRPAAAQQSASTALEGYISMEDGMIAPNTLPAGFMLNSKVGNLVVATAVGSTHVAFSSVRLEPTWMLIGTAAGKLAVLALNSRHADKNNPSDTPGSIMAVPLLELQRSVVGRQPLVLYDDLRPSSPYYLPMQLLGPHGVADDENFSAHPSTVLSRGRATRWLLGALLARNSTALHLATAPLPSPSDSRWRDLGPGDDFFSSALACSHAGAFPLPNPKTDFNPDVGITDTEWRGWVRNSLDVAVPPSPNPSRTCSRGNASQVLYHAVIVVGH